MLKTAFSRAPPTAIRFDSANWVGTDALPRDRTQSQRLHEPAYRVNTTDPMTGEHIKDTKGHPSLVDGNLTIFFSTEETRKAYLNLPIDHPNPQVPFAATDEDDRGG